MGDTDGGNVDRGEAGTTGHGAAGGWNGAVGGWNGAALPTAGCPQTGQNRCPGRTGCPHAGLPEPVVPAIVTAG